MRWGRIINGMELDSQWDGAGFAVMQVPFLMEAEEIGTLLVTDHLYQGMNLSL